MSSTLLQLFLLLTVFSIGVCSTLAVQYALAHYRPHPEPKKVRRPENDARLTPEAKERIQKQSEERFQAVMERTASGLQHDLEATANALNKVLQKIGSEVVGNEMERYRLQLEQIRKQADGAISGAQSEIDKHQLALRTQLEEEQATLRAKLTQEIAAERDRLMQELATDNQRLANQIDQRLADAVASFLLETLGHDVDLGAQAKYLTATLEQHKDEFKQSITA